MAEVALAGATDVEKAVAAARRAFDDGPWPRMSAAERGRKLAAVSRLLRERQETLALLESRNSGKALVDARDEVGGAARTFEYYSGAPDKLLGDTIPVSGGGFDFTLREPVEDAVFDIDKGSSRTALWRGGHNRAGSGSSVKRNQKKPSDVSQRVPIGLNCPSLALAAR